MASRLQTKKNQPNLWLEHFAQCRQVNIQQDVESQRRFHLSLMDGRPGFKYEELVDDWLDHTVLEAEKNEPQH